MNWFYLALIPPALYATVNHVDKYLVRRYFPNAGAGSLLIFSSLIGAALFPFILIAKPDVLEIAPLHALLMIGNGILYIVALLPYLWAIQREETSVATPLFQTIPVFGYALGYVFLGETLSQHELIGSILILIGAFVLSLELHDGARLIHPHTYNGVFARIPRSVIGVGVKRDILGLMLLSSFLIAVGGTLFKFVALETDFWTATFWDYIGLTLTALFTLLFITNARREFFGAIRAFGMRFIAINAAGEAVTIVATLISAYATLLAPIALVWSVNGFQPMFTLAIGVFLTLFIPRWGKERIGHRDLAQKALAVALMLAGAYFITA